MRWKIWLDLHCALESSYVACTHNSMNKERIPHRIVCAKCFMDDYVIIDHKNYSCGSLLLRISRRKKGNKAEEWNKILKLTWKMKRKIYKCLYKYKKINFSPEMIPYPPEATWVRKINLRWNSDFLVREKKRVIFLPGFINISYIYFADTKKRKLKIFAVKSDKKQKQWRFFFLFSWFRNV